MKRTPYHLDVCSANGPVLVSREIANYLRRVPKVPPDGVTALWVAPDSARRCWTVLAHTAANHYPLIDTPTEASARFLCESLATLWRVTDETEL